MFRTFVIGTRTRRLASAFHPPLRRAVAGLYFVGVLIAIWGATLAAGRPAAGPWIVFLFPIVGLTVLGIATLRGAGWALVTDVAVLGAQVIGVIGVLWELAHFGESSKAAEVVALGVDPLFGLLANLAFSLVGAAFLYWIVMRLRGAQQRPWTGPR